MDTKEIQELIKFVDKSGVREVRIESKRFKRTKKTSPYKRNGQPEVQLVQAVQPVAPAQTAQVAAPPPVPAVPKEEKAAAPAASDNLEEIRSPMIGTFYRSPTPEKPPFVSVGDEVKKGDVICI